MRSDAKPHGKVKEYVVRGTIPANSSDTVLSKEIDGSVNFFCREIRGSFTTLQDDGQGAIVDYGVNSLRFRIVEGGTDYQFFDNFADAEMMLSPGRKRSSLATNNSTALGTNPVYEPLPFVHHFTKRIEVPVINSSDIDQDFEIVFMGYESRQMQRA